MGIGLIQELESMSDEQIKIQKKLRILEQQVTLSIGIVDEKYIREIEEKISNLKKSIEVSSIQTIEQQVDSLLNKISELINYYNLINKVKYIDNNIKKIKKSNILEWVKTLTDILENLLEDKIFYLDSQKENVNLVYEVVYKIIKMEMLFNNESLLLNIVEEKEICLVYLKNLIDKEIEEILSSAYGDLLVTKHLEYLKEREDIFTNNDLGNEKIKAIIRTIVMVTDFDKVKKNMLKDEATRVNSLIDSKKTILDGISNDLEPAIEKKKNLIKSLNSKIKSARSNIFLFLLATSTIMLNLYNINNSVLKYPTEIRTYSSLYGIEESESLEEKLVDAVHYSHKDESNEEIKEYDFRRILEVNGSPYYDETGERIRDYTIYDISDFAISDDLSIYGSLDTRDIQDKVIEEGTKISRPEESRVKVKEIKQDLSKKQYDEKTKNKNKFSFKLILLNILSSLLYLSLLYKDKKSKKKINEEINELTKRINDLINTYVEKQEKDETELKILEFLINEMNLLEIDEYEEIYMELLKTDHETINKRLKELR